ncbi:MAG TPA: YhdP family protein [Gammaproteobacteria bacterium]|nr:YhdP family protein [Gammaproteobacteria bacterium]
MKTPRYLKRLGRALLGVAAGVVILLAVAVGGFRLAVRQLPSYEAELRAWLNESLGLELDYDTLNARWGLHGPELTFRGVSVAASGREEPFLVAKEARVVIDPWTAITERRLRIGRLSIDGTRFALVRERTGALHLLGAPAGSEARLDLALVVPRGIRVGVRNSSVVYDDRQDGLSWTFRDVDADLTRGSDVLQVEASARPPDELGSRFEIAVQSEARDASDLGRNWRLFVDARDVDLAALAPALPALAPIPSHGAGHVAVWLEWTGGALARGMLETALDDVDWSAAARADSASGYRHVSLSAEWLRNSSGGWHVTLDDVDLDRGQAWPSGQDAVIDVDRGPDGIKGVSVRADFVRLEDLAPLVRTLPGSALARQLADPALPERWLELAPRGELSGIDLSLAPGAEGWSYTLAGRFAGLGVDARGTWPGFTGLSGEIRADSSSGRVSLATRGAALDFPALFRNRLAIDELSGIVVWRKGFDGVRVVGDDLVLANRDATTRTSLELTLPAAGGSPLLDMETRFGPFDVAAAKRYLPVHKMPAAVVQWLDQSLAGGRATKADVRFFGPLAAFPFDGGEGQFRASVSIENAVLDYVAGWPRAEDLDGTVEFVNASFAARATGRVLGNVGRDVRVDIPDLRNATLALHADTEGPLADVLGFLQAAPPIAARLGPGYERLHALAGRGAVALDLSLPLKDLAAYDVKSRLGIADGELAVDGFGPHATEVDGALELADGVLRGSGIKAIFLDGPVTADVLPPGADEPAYRAKLDFAGEVTADAVAKAFRLPFADLAAGQTRWQGELLIPAQTDDEAGPPLSIRVASNLAGVALNFPAPFDKAPADPLSLEVGIELPDSRHARLSGHLGATRRFTLAFEDSGDGAELTGGALRFGGAEPVLPPGGGLVVDGTLPHLHFDEWLALMHRSAPGAELASGAVGELFEQADLDVADFRVLGQRLGMSRLSVRRSDAEWDIGIDSEAVAGRISVPLDLASRPQIVARMQRLYLEGGASGGTGASFDPRKLVGLSLEADAFGFGARRFGSLSADVQSDRDGLRLVSFKSKSDAFTTEGSGGWFVEQGAPVTRLQLKLDSTNVEAALKDLALAPIASGKKAEVTATVQWPGAPSSSWMQHVAGELSMHFENGSLLDIDPGAGRVVGLMSITALPRRLALDFRDVFNKGLVFDEISGDFLLADGNAYSDNLKVAGPAAEIGVAGRVGLRDHDFAQQAVVTAEPGKVLPTVGGLIGGAGVGAALLIFTRIFKEPLKGIGRASYCVTGDWDAPKVERLSAEQLQEGRICAELPAGGLPHEKKIEAAPRRAGTARTSASRAAPRVGGPAPQDGGTDGAAAQPRARGLKTAGPRARREDAPPQEEPNRREEPH